MIRFCNRLGDGLGNRLGDGFGDGLGRGLGVVFGDGFGCGPYHSQRFGIGTIAFPSLLQNLINFQGFLSQA